MDNARSRGKTNKEDNEFNINFLIHTYLSGKREIRILRFSEEKRSLFENTCQVSFLRILYCPPFRIVLHSSLLYLSGICSLRASSR